MTQEFDSLLMTLADESRPVRSIDLFPLSDLDRGRLPRFSGAWSGLTPARRRELAAALVEQAEANIHFNFHTVLRSLLGDQDEVVRRLAIEGLWEDEKPSLVALLIGLLREDTSVDVRASAAGSLGRFVLLGILEEVGREPASAAESALHETWFREGEAPTVRRRALEGLAYGSLPDLNELILNAYYDESEPMRQSALFAMGRTADSRWAKLVMSEMESHEAAMRFEAAQAAGEMGLRPAVQQLIRHVDDPDESVREASVAALGKIGGPVAKRVLQVLVKSEDEALAQAADDALAELNFGAEVDEDGLAPVNGRGRSPRHNGDGDDADDDIDDAGDLDEDLDDDFDVEDELEWDSYDFKDEELDEENLAWDDEDEGGREWDGDEGDVDDDLAEDDDDF
jgi:HEAT repeat protein